MTDEEIKKGLQGMMLTLDWGTVERIGAVSTDGSGENRYGGVPKNVAIIQATLDYINRLKDEIAGLTGKADALEADRDNLLRTLDEANEEIEQARKETAREIFKTVLDDCKSLDFFDSIFEEIQALADDEYGIRIMKENNEISVEVNE